MGGGRVGRVSGRKWKAHGADRARVGRRRRRTTADLWTTRLLTNWGKPAPEARPVWPSAAAAAHADRVESAASTPDDRRRAPLRAPDRAVGRRPRRRRRSPSAARCRAPSTPCSPPCAGSTRPGWPISSPVKAAGATTRSPRSSPTSPPPSTGCASTASSTDRRRSPGTTSPTCRRRRGRATSSASPAGASTTWRGRASSCATVLDAVGVQSAARGHHVLLPRRPLHRVADARSGANRTR